MLGIIRNTMDKVYKSYKRCRLPNKNQSCKFGKRRAICCMFNNLENKNSNYYFVSNSHIHIADIPMDCLDTIRSYLQDKFDRYWMKHWNNCK